MSKDVIVKNSKIQGKGVFAVRDFKKEEIVLKWKISKKLTKAEVEKLPEKEKHYVNFVDGYYFVQKSPERHVNHSCEPNTRVGFCCDIATREISKGEEITSDYAKDSIPDLVIHCNCGSKKCRGTIYCDIKK